MMQITCSTDGKFVGLVFDPDKPIFLGDTLFVPDYIKPIAGGYRYSNSNYVFDAKEI